MDAAGELNAAVAEPIGAVHYAPSPGPAIDDDDDDDDCDDLYGDVNLSFLPLPPLSPSPSSPPKTPSPGLSLPSPSPPPRRNLPPKPQPHPEPEQPQQNPTPQHQPPLPAPKPPSSRQPEAPTFRQEPPRRAPVRSTPSPPTTALYLGDLPWWTTDAEVEAALAPHGALDELYFYSEKFSGRSRGFCRADFLHPAAATSAAAALHGRVFDGHHCVASLSCPPELRRLGLDSDPDAPAPNPVQGHGGNASSATTARRKVGSLGDGSSQGPMAPRPRPLGANAMIGGGFPSIGQYNAGMCTDMMPPPMVAPHVNPAYMAASRMAMCGTQGTGMWHNQGMAGGLWGGLQPWNFGGCEMPWLQQQHPGQAQQQPRMQQHPRQAQQQQHRNGGYIKKRGTSGRNQDRDNGNVRGNPDRRQYGHGGGGEQNRGERDRHREYVNCNDKDRHGGEQRRYQQYTERDDWERRGRTRSRSQSRDSDDDDHPRRRR